MIIIPAIDLRSGRCVRLTQGRKDNATVYDGDPIEIALSYQAGGAPIIHIVDLDGAFSDSNSQNRQGYLTSSVYVAHHRRKLKATVYLPYSPHCTGNGIK